MTDSPCGNCGRTGPKSTRISPHMGRCGTCGRDPKPRKMSPDPNEVHSDEWHKKFKERQDSLKKKITKLAKSVKKLIERLKNVHADMLMDDLEGHPKRQKEFIDKLYNPFYTPTAVEEIVIQKLLEKDTNGQDL